jgi:hypothetical protein
MPFRTLLTLQIRDSQADGQRLLVADNCAAHNSQDCVRLQFPDLASGGCRTCWGRPAMTGTETT